MVKRLRERMKEGFTLGPTRLTYRKRVVIIVVGLAIVITSLVFTTSMARELKHKEQYEVSLWALALERMWDMNWYMNMNDPFFHRVVHESNNVPFIIVDGSLNVVLSNLIPDKVLTHPDLLRKAIDRLSSINQEMKITGLDGSTLYVFYGESLLLKMLKYFPLVQLVIIIIFATFAYITFHSSKHDEQNRVWIGLAKETAHQLGTPTSSLLGWVEYLRSQPIDQMAVEEMSKDLTRLMKVVDRFSKIGSETILSPANINEVVGESVIYFNSRIPRNVTLEYNGLAIAPVKANINLALFEWVVENLLKNALDALQGRGVIKVNISSDDNWIYVDVTDTGKGMAKNYHKRIFEPGFTTKTRGWGLGLSLSRRIIETYHKGKIAVVESEIGKGTTMRVTLKKLYL